MSLIINSNLASLNAQRQLTQTNNELSTSLERLSSGKRINSAADDAAGLSISNRMTSQVRGLNQAVRNAMDGISMIQVAEGALQESSNLLQRMRELAIQASNGIYSDLDRATLDAEVQQLVQEVNRIAETTSFNGQTILQGDKQDVSLQVGAEANQTISFGIPAMDASSLGLGSTNGDVVGAELSIANDGGLSTDILAGAVKINGKSLSSYTAGTSLQTILDDINESVTGVTATAVASITTTQVGDGVLANGDSITLSGSLFDGSSQSFTLSNTTSLDDLVDAINTKTGSLIQATISDDGTLALSSDKFATLTLQDTTQGSATGVNETQIADADIAEVIEGLTSSWISEAENLIETYFGIKGDGADLTLDLTFSDGAGNVAAAVSASLPGGGGLGTNLTLNIDMVDFTASGDPSGGSPYLYMDRIIAHEMVHAVMYRNVNMLPAAMPSWFAEGAAEFIHGGDERVELDIAAGNLDNQTELSAAFATGKIGSTITPTGYSAGYTAVRMMHDDIINAGGTGINEVMNYLAAGDDISTALANVASDHGGGTGWNSLASFETDFDTTGYAYMTSALTFEGGVGTETDTGSIAGSDYGGANLNAEDILANAGTGPSQDFNLIIPTEYSGGLTTSDAKLILTSDSGDAITVSLGANGTDTDLATLGLLLMDEGNVVGQSLSEADQNAALNTNDLTINGVAITSVDAGAGLLAKVNAINDMSDETGVVGNITATQSFKFDSDSTLEYVSAGAISLTANGVLGFNGVGFAVSIGDTAYDIAAQINGTTEAHGVKAYVDESARLHVFGKANINPGANPTSVVTGDINFGIVPGPAGSVVINGSTVSLTDITDKATVIEDINALNGTTGVIAQVDDNGNLELKSTAAIKISLGDTNGMQSLHALGMSFGINGDENLSDTDNDDLFGDEVFVINPRIELNSITGQAIQLKVTSEGTTATGLKNLNSDDTALSGSSLANISVANASQAQKAIGAIDNALESINDARSQLGAINNRLDFTVSNLTAISEKTATARSRIMDADFAMETAQLSRAQVLQQASQAMLAQANARPQQVLQLLN